MEKQKRIEIPTGKCADAASDIRKELAKNFVMENRLMSVVVEMLQDVTEPQYLKYKRENWLMQPVIFVKNLPRNSVMVNLLKSVVAET